MNQNNFFIENYILDQSNVATLNDLLVLFPDANALQFPSFAFEFYNRRSCRIFILKNSDLKISGLCIVTETLKFCEINFGPILTDVHLAEVFLERIIRFYKNKLFGQLKIMLPENTALSNFEKINIHINNQTNNTAVKKHFWYSMRLDLRKSIDEIKKGFSENLIRNLKKSIGSGLSVKPLVEESTVKEFAHIYDELYRFRKIRAQWNNSEKVFLNWFNSESFRKKSIWLGLFNSSDKLLGGTIFIKQREVLFYQIGASDHANGKLPVLHLCFFEAIKIAKERGFIFFDFGGYDMDAKIEDQTYQINRFKKQFGGELFKGSQQLIVPLNKTIYFLQRIFFKLQIV